MKKFTGWLQCFGAAAILLVLFSIVPVSSAADTTFKTGTDVATKYACGSGADFVAISIDLGCKGNACVNNQKSSSFCSSDHNAVLDMTFAIIKILSYGVGLVVIASMVFAGIQYTASRGDPQASAAATKRISSNVTALLIFIFAYAILNYLVPGQVLK